ncbi:MAG TPA: SMC-Scp complex subunit ScpB [Candidatus Methylomirabilis sp.]|nr:SMC-Scp complex subunit ScpB [Candidatus Methylomirabilis sp.]
MATPSLESKIEAVLFAGARPFTVKRLAELCEVSLKDVEEALDGLEKQLENTAVMIQRAGNEVQFVTRPEHAKLVQQVVRDEIMGELSRPSLEALTILAYRGPLTRPEIEQIRGVHSSIILRNLMMRGLVEEKEDSRLGQPIYSVTFDFIRHLGLKGVDGLPDYDELRGNQNVEDVLKDLDPEPLTKAENAEATKRMTV